MGGNGAEGREEGAVYGSCVEKEDSYDLLDQGDVLLVEFGHGVGSGRELCGGSILGCGPLVGCMLWFGWRCMLEALQCFLMYPGIEMLMVR